MMVLFGMLILLMRHLSWGLPSYESLLRYPYQFAWGKRSRRTSPQLLLLDQLSVCSCLPSTCITSPCVSWLPDNRPARQPPSPGRTQRCYQTCGLIRWVVLRHRYEQCPSSLLDLSRTSGRNHPAELSPHQPTLLAFFQVRLSLPLLFFYQLVRTHLSRLPSYLPLPRRQVEPIST